MGKVYLQVKLGVRPVGGGAAELVMPPELDGVDFRFVQVKDGAEEGIVVVDEEPSMVAKLTSAADVTQLSSTRQAKVRTSYPEPRLKQKYRAPATPVHGESATVFETDEEGRPVVQTVQTVRAGYYLIDVPVAST